MELESHIHFSGTDLISSGAYEPSSCAGFLSKDAMALRTGFKSIFCFCCALCLKARDPALSFWSKPSVGMNGHVTSESPEIE
eukprot:771815-Rhodomonas_salina.4